MKKGSHFTPEQLERVSNATRKRFAEGGVGANKGRKFSLEWRKKLSLAKLGTKRADWVKKKLSISRMGVKNHQWKGGQTKEERAWQKNRWHKRRRNAPGGHSFGEWENLKAQYNWTCPCCKKREPEIKLSLDHIIPLSKGGSENIENIQPLCKSCNCKKHTKTIKY